MNAAATAYGAGRSGCPTPAPPQRRWWRAARVVAWALGVLGSLCGPLSTAQAHQASDAYLQARTEAGRTTVRADVALRDLDLLLPQLDADGDRQLSWAEVRRAQAAIAATVLGALALGDCRFTPDAAGAAGQGGPELARRADGVYAVVRAAADCRLTAASPLRWHLLAGVDATHRGLLRLDLPGEPTPRVQVLVPGVPVKTLAPTPAAAASASLGTATPTDAVHGGLRATDAEDAADAAQGAAPAPAAASNSHAMPGSFVVEGMRHLLGGWDHLLFLLCLLLPAVLQRRAVTSDGARQGWQPATDLRAVAGPVLRTITLFTLAHSITLALAALGPWRPAPSLVEPAIALSILVAALDNLRPRLWRWREALTFGFGLIHGFGFAGALAELDLPAGAFGWALLQFNLGLEVGQLAVVALLLPLLMLWRGRALYVPAVLRGGSGLAAAVAAFWFVERSLGAAGLV